VLTYTTKPLTLAKGFESLLKPLARLNIPIEKLSLMLVITIRFIPTIQEELQRILLTQKARGFDMERLPFAKRLYSYVPIIVPLLFTTVQRADHLSEAIDARGYGDGKNRTSYYVLHYDKQDVATIVLAVCCVFILFVL
jgi:energy-coupling factor transport system permease protein